MKSLGQTMVSAKSDALLSVASYSIATVSSAAAVDQASILLRAGAVPFREPKSCILLICSDADPGAVGTR